MERFIYGSVFIDGQYTKRDGLLHFKNPVLKHAVYIPDFNILSFDIETGRDGTIYSIGLHATYKDESRKEVLMRSKELESGTTDDFITYYNTEKELLQTFLLQVSRLDPDIIIGWHVIGFDLDFIRRRLEFYHIPFRLGRNGKLPVIKKNLNNNWNCSIHGRVVIDGPPTLRGAFYSFENFKLETVATVVLGVGKDISGSGKVDEIERRFREDKKALAYYNLLDCTLVTDIYKKLGLIDLTFTRAITCGLTMDRIGMSVAAFDYYMLPQVHRKGFVAPDIDDINATNQGGGGLVFIKEPGFYESIIVLDFKSLYPSIIRTFFIDPLSLLQSDIDTIYTPVDIPFSSTEHVLPDYIKILMDKRALAKKDKNDHLSQAIKILMNSFYGVMGTTLCRFYNPNLPDAITGTGQWFLNRTREFLEDKGYTVIYGDTDSLFVKLKPEECTNYNRSAEDITNVINDYLSGFIKSKFKVESLLEIEYEKHFRKFFLPGVRGGGAGAKKRYAGLLSSENGETLSFTGLEFVRSDWTKLAKEFQYNLFTLIFSNMEVVNYIKDVVKDLCDGKLDKDLIYKKRLTKPASEYTKIIPPQVRAALMLDPEGKSIRQVEYIITKNGPIPTELIPEMIDYDHYIDKQLKPIADSLLPFIQKNFETIVFNKQPELF